MLIQYCKWIISKLLWIFLDEPKWPTRLQQWTSLIDQKCQSAICIFDHEEKKNSLFRLCKQNKGWDQHRHSVSLKKKKGFLGLQQRHGNYDPKNDDMTMELQ